jgi:hypothetical protein
MYTVSPEEALSRLRSGETWSDFCDMLKAAGQVLHRPGTPDDALTRAEGVRYLSRVLRAGLEAFVEHADPGAPSLRRVVHETSKLGNDNPDSYYLNAEIDGARSYVLRGTRGSVRFLELATQIGSYGEGGGMPPSGHLDSSELVIRPDGTFEVWIGPERRGENWLRTVPATRTLIIRQNRLDPDAETLCALDLQPAEGPGAPTPLTPERVDVGLMKAAMLVATAPRLFAEWIEGFQAHVNQLPRFDQAVSDRMGGVPFIRYHHSAWRLADDEALVIRVPAWACDHWNFAVSNHWLESLDYRYHRIHTNSVLAHTSADGSAVLVVAHRDPGVPNWLSTDGHGHGAMCFRWVRPAPFEPPDPACEVVPLASLRTP